MMGNVSKEELFYLFSVFFQRERLWGTKEANEAKLAFLNHNMGLLTS